MVDCHKYVCHFCTLGRLYRIDNFKDRVHWLIVIVFQLLLPTFIVLMSDQNEVAAYNFHTATHYRVKMRDTCDIYKLVPDGAHFDEPNTFIDTLVSALHMEKGNNGSHSAQGTDEHGVAEDLTRMLMTLRTFRKFEDSPIKSQEKEVVTEECCDIYRQAVDEQLDCLRKLGRKTSALSFVITMYCPFIGTFLLALLMTPLKLSRRLQGKCFKEDERPSVQSTEEKIRRVQNRVQFIVDLSAYYCVVYKIWELGSGLNSCINTSPCTPRYISLQIAFLLGVAQTPWLSMLWSFIYT